MAPALLVGFFLISSASLANTEIQANQLTSTQIQDHQPSTTVINGSQLIVVELGKTTLRFFENGRLIKKYRMAIGKPKTPTPVGIGFIRSKGQMVFQYWEGPKKGQIIRWSQLSNGRLIKIPYHKMMGFGIVIPGPGCDLDKYYIHATTDESVIGQAVSGGCIRMTIKDMLELYPLVKVGARLIIKP